MIGMSANFHQHNFPSCLQVRKVVGVEIYMSANDTEKPTGFEAALMSANLIHSF